jgi:uncharacterized membrane protein YgcG
MKAPRFGALLLSFFLAAILCAPVFGDIDQRSASQAQPGTLNYVEGQVFIGNHALNSKSIGNAELQPGQSLTTDTGKAEILLTPGVFLRVGDHSSVSMISPNLTNTQVEVNTGHAIVEADQIFPANDIRVTEDGTTTRLLKTGLYDFDQNRAELRVFDGKATVDDNGRNVTVKGGHELSFAPDASAKAKGFDKKAYEEDDLYRWSSLRSAYVAEANVNAAGLYAYDGWGPWGGGWWGAGWYWDPWFTAYTFIPGDGIFYSPFGWGFYSPWWVYDAPLFYGGYGFGYGYRPYYHHFSDNWHNWGFGDHYPDHSYAHGIYTGPGSTGHGFHSGPQMAGRAGGFGGHGIGGFHGGGFHGGGGGFGGGGDGR